MPDKETRAALLNAGAPAGSVYTRDELQTLVELYHRGSLTLAELLRVHLAKQTFNGRVLLAMSTTGNPREQTKPI